MAEKKEGSPGRSIGKWGAMGGKTGEANIAVILKEVTT